MMRRKTLQIICNECGRTLFRYVKIGKGTVWHCWKSRILEDYTVREGIDVKCPCGNLIGTEKSQYIKMKRHSFRTE
jgi:hypothetical protein